MRLDRYICECSSLTRSQAKKKIKQNSVTVNDQVITDGGYQVNLTSDVVFLEDVMLQYEEYC